MTRFLANLSPYCYALLRIIAGLMFMTHGTQKLFGIPGGSEPVVWTTLAGVAGIIEVLCGALIVIGLQTVYAAFVASGEMAFAYFIAHASQGFWPTINRGEQAVLYCFLFLYVASRGAGIWSVDRATARVTT